jgi:uncharacterized protein involved in exopolysaccharide biosynthesis
MSTEPIATPSRRPDPAQGAGALGLLVLIGTHRRTIGGWTVAAAVAGIAYAFLSPKTFTGVTRILPPQQGQSVAAMMVGQLGGGLGGLAAGSLGIKNPSDLYIGMMKSQTVADALVERFKLKTLYGKDYLAEARARLAEDSHFLSEKSGIITVQVDARDPQLAAELANAYVEELHRLTSTLAVGEAAQRRVFFERQALQTKDKLADAEMKLRQALDSGGLVSVDAQGRAAVETVARVRGQISAKEIQIGAMQAYAAPSNPDLQRAERELSAMKQELSRLESGVPGGDAPGGDIKGIGHIRLMRDVKYNEALFEALAKQYELARVEEAREAPLVQVLDRATPPERKSGPRRALIVILATLGGFVAATLAVVARRRVNDASRSPEFQGRMAAVRDAWKGRQP